jgi:hypothetical protein
VEHFILTAAAAYLGSLAAIATFWGLAGRSLSADASTSASPRPPHNKWLSLGGAGAFSLIAALLFYLVSNGEMAPGLALIALVVSLLVIVFSVRTLRT